MPNTEMFTPDDFDSNRVDIRIPEFAQNERLGLDPNYPDYVVRRNTAFHKIERAEMGKWRPAEDAKIWPHLSVEAVSEITELASAELQQLEACGLPTPERSEYIVREEYDYFGKPHGVAYNYTCYVDGVLLDPSKPEYGQFAIAYAKAALNYLRPKTAGDLFLNDLLARNCMVGVQKGSTPETPPQLFFIDTEPGLEPVSTEMESEYMDSQGQDIGPKTITPTFIEAIYDIQRVIDDIALSGDRAQALEIASLRHQAKVMLTNFGY